VNQSQLTVDLQVEWLDERPRLHVHLDPAGTVITLVHGDQQGMRSRLLAMVRPLLADLERLPETQPREDDLTDETPF
jgi:hypothetical protein